MRGFPEGMAFGWTYNHSISTWSLCSLDDRLMSPSRTRRITSDQGSPLLRMVSIFFLCASGTTFYSRLANFKVTYYTYLN